MISEASVLNLRTMGGADLNSDEGPAVAEEDHLPPGMRFGV